MEPQPSFELTADEVIEQLTAMLGERDREIAGLRALVRRLVAPKEPVTSERQST